MYNPNMEFLRPEQYQPKAWEVFFSLKESISRVLPFARIEHIGSSSVEGCISKGDLDIFVGVDAEQFENSIELIQSLGFQIKTESFRSKELCPFYLKHPKLDVGLQLVLNRSQFEDFIRFRDALRTSHELLCKYNELKSNFTLLSHEKYREEKSEFIVKTLSSINRIPK